MITKLKKTPGPNRRLYSHWWWWWWCLFFLFIYLSETCDSYGRETKRYKILVGETWKKETTLVSKYTLGYNTGLSQRNSICGYGFIWLRIKINGWLLWLRHWTFRFHKSRTTQHSERALCSMELVYFILSLGLSSSLFYFCFSFHSSAADTPINPLLLLSFFLFYFLPHFQVFYSEFLCETWS
jgi:hypothetical protein